MKKKKKVDLDTDLDAEDLKKLVDLYKKAYKAKLKKAFPQDPLISFMRQ